MLRDIEGEGWRKGMCFKEFKNKCSDKVDMTIMSETFFLSENLTSS